MLSKMNDNNRPVDRGLAMDVLRFAKIEGAMRLRVSAVFRCQPVGPYPLHEQRDWHLPGV